MEIKNNQKIKEESSEMAVLLSFNVYLAKLTWQEYIENKISKLDHASLAKGSDPWEEMGIKSNKELNGRIVRNDGSSFV